MPAYRCYFLDKDDHISGTEIIHADALNAAIEQAFGWLIGLDHHRSIELWQGETRLCSALLGFQTVLGR
jgi:hypothetical protein